MAKKASPINVHHILHEFHINMISLFILYFNILLKHKNNKLVV